MQKDAEAFAAEDHKRREAAEARNTADNLTYQVDKALAEYGDKVPAEERDGRREGERRREGGAEGRRRRPDQGRRPRRSWQAFQRIGQAMYAQQQAQQAAAGGGRRRDAAERRRDVRPRTAGDGDVVEGEIVDEGGAS